MGCFDWFAFTSLRQNRLSTFGIILGSCFDWFAFTSLRRYAGSLTEVCQCCFDWFAFTSLRPKVCCWSYLYSWCCFDWFAFTSLRRLYCRRHMLYTSRSCFDWLAFTSSTSAGRVSGDREHRSFLRVRPPPPPAVGVNHLRRGRVGHRIAEAGLRRTEGGDGHCARPRKIRRRRRWETDTRVGQT